jgi:hypothetical protein
MLTMSQVFADVHIPNMLETATLGGGDGAAEAGGGDRADVQIPIKIYRGRTQRDARRSKVQPRQAANKLTLSIGTASKK